MLDRYWFAEPVALATEAPVPVVSINTDEYRAGGAANVALNIKKLGGDVAILAPLGRDPFGQILSSILDEAKVKQHWLYDGDINTITKHRVLSSKQQLLRVDFEQKYNPVILDNHVKDLIGEHDVIVCSDYNKGALGNTQQFISYARSINKLVLVDPKGSDFIKYHSATILTPNYKEFTEVVGAIADQKDFAIKAYNLINKLELEYLLVTCGSDGMVLFGHDNYKYSASSYAQQVYDVTGAGDTVLASLAVSLANNEAYSVAIERASYAAAYVVSQVGTGFVTADEIDRQMANYAAKVSQQHKNSNDKLVKIISTQDLSKLYDLSSIYNKYYLYTLESKHDQIVTAKTISELININSDNIWVILNNKLNDIPHSLYTIDQIAYMLSRIAVISKVIYSMDNKIDLYKIFEHLNLKNKEQKIV